MADELTFEFRTPTDKMKSDLAQARSLIRQFGTDAERDVASAADRINNLISSAGSKLNTGLKIALGDFGLAVDKLINITEAGLKGIPVVGEGIAAAYHQVSGTLLEATERGIAYNDMLRRQQIQLGLVAGDAADVRREMAEIADITFRTNVGRGFLVNAVEDLQLFNVEGQKAVDLVRALATQATATGGGEARVGALTDLIERVLETGKVDGRTVRQFVRQKVPIYDILADELQVSKKRAMQLVESGELSGDDFIAVLTHAFTGPKWTRAAEEMTQTVDGLTRRYDRAIDKLLGVVTQPVHATTVDFLRQAVDVVRGPGAQGVAAGMQSAISPITGLMESTARALASGDFTGGALKLGSDIKAGLAKGVTGAGLDFAKSYLGEFAKGIGAQSPATEFIPLGEYSAQGWRIGFLAEMQKSGGVMGLFQGGRGPLSPNVSRYDDIIEAAAQRYGIDANLIRAVMQQESGGRRTVVSSAGAQGLMQLMPGTARRFGVTDPFDPRQNIFGGAAYLRFLSDRYPGNLDKILAGYNAGEGNVDKYGGVPPFKQTQGYVQSVEAIYGRLNQNIDELTAAVRDLAASTNWRLRGDRSPDEGRDLSRFPTGADTLRDLTGGLGEFTNFRDVPAGSGLDDAPAQGIPGLDDALGRMAESVGLFNGKLKDSGVYIEGVGDVAQKDVVPVLQTMYALLLDDQKAIEDFGQRGGEALEKVRARVHGAGQSLREFGFTAENMKRLFMSSVDDALSHAREGWGVMLKTAVKDFGLAIAQMIFKAEEARLLDKLFGTSGPNGSAGLLGKLFGGLFGGGSGSGGGVTVGGFSGGLFHIGGAAGGGRSGGLLGTLGSLFGFGGGGTAASPAGGPWVDPASFTREFGAAPALTGAGASSASFASLLAGAAPMAAAAAAEISISTWIAAAQGKVSGGRALLGGGVLGWLLGLGHNKTEKKLREAIRSEYGVDVKEMDVLTHIKQIGEARFGKGKVRDNLSATIHLPEVMQLLQNYAEETGQTPKGALAPPEPKLLGYVEERGRTAGASIMGRYSDGSLRPLNADGTPYGNMGGYSMFAADSLYQAERVRRMKAQAEEDKNTRREDRRGDAGAPVVRVVIEDHAKTDPDVQRERTIRVLSNDPRAAEAVLGHVEKDLQWQGGRLHSSVAGSVFHSYRGGHDQLMHVLEDSVRRYGP